MTLDQFIALHNGHFLVWDRNIGASCVALAEFYATDVLGIPAVWANAVDWYGKDAGYLAWVRNVWGNPASKPARGDYVTWGPNARAGTGIYGHIAVCTDPGDGITFGAFSQNYPTGSACQLRRFTFDGVIGWGDKPTPPPPPPPPDPCAQVKADLAGVVGQLAAANVRVNQYAAWIATRPQ